MQAALTPWGPSLPLPCCLHLREAHSLYWPFAGNMTGNSENPKELPLRLLWPKKYLRNRRLKLNIPFGSLGTESVYATPFPHPSDSISEMWQTHLPCAQRYGSPVIPETLLTAARTGTGGGSLQQRPPRGLQAADRHKPSSLLKPRKTKTNQKSWVEVREEYFTTQMMVNIWNVKSFQKTER